MLTGTGLQLTLLYCFKLFSLKMNDHTIMGLCHAVALQFAILFTAIGGTLLFPF